MACISKLWIMAVLVSTSKHEKGRHALVVLMSDRTWRIYPRRFGLVKGECRRAALVPAQAGDGLGGQIMASVLSKITFAPKGMVEGSAPEEVLARADYLLEVRGEIRAIFDLLRCWGEVVLRSTAEA